MKNIKTILTIITLLCSSNAFSSDEVAPKVETASCSALLAGKVPKSMLPTSSTPSFIFTLTPTSTYRDMQNQLKAVDPDVKILRVLVLQDDGLILATNMDGLLDTKIDEYTRNKLNFCKDRLVTLVLTKKT